MQSVCSGMMWATHTHIHNVDEHRKCVESRLNVEKEFIAYLSLKMKLPSSFHNLHEHTHTLTRPHNICMLQHMKSERTNNLNTWWGIENMLRVQFLNLVWHFQRFSFSKTEPEREKKNKIIGNASKCSNRRGTKYFPRNEFKVNRRRWKTFSIRQRKRSMESTQCKLEKTNEKRTQPSPFDCCAFQTYIVPIQSLSSSLLPPSPLPSTMKDQCTFLLVIHSLCSVWALFGIMTALCLDKRALN